MNESCHTWMSHVTHEWIMSHMNESCHTWMNHVTHEWVLVTNLLYNISLHHRDGAHHERSHCLPSKHRFDLKTSHLPVKRDSTSDDSLSNAQKYPIRNRPARIVSDNFSLITVVFRTWPRNKRTSNASTVCFFSKRKWFLQERIKAIIIMVFPTWLVNYSCIRLSVDYN